MYDDCALLSGRSISGTFGDDCDLWKRKLDEIIAMLVRKNILRTRMDYICFTICWDQKIAYTDLKFILNSQYPLSYFLRRGWYNNSIYIATSMKSQFDYNANQFWLHLNVSRWLNWPGEEFVSQFKSRQLILRRSSVCLKIRASEKFVFQVKPMPAINKRIAVFHKRQYWKLPLKWQYWKCQNLVRPSN